MFFQVSARNIKGKATDCLQETRDPEDVTECFKMTYTVSK